jgi:hypothetical protein
MKKKKAKAKVARKSKPKKAAKKPAKSKVKAAKSKAKKPAKGAKRKGSKAGAGKNPPKPGVIAPPNSVLLGYVEDYFAKIGVVALTLEAGVSVGSRVHILGHTTNFEQTVDSMQIDHQPVTQAGKKDSVGIKVTTRARCGDHVYLIK